MEWQIDKFYENKTYFKTKEIGGTTYMVQIWLDERPKTIRFYCAISSGSKRSDLQIFEQKDKKSCGEVKALLWCLGEFLDFPKYYKSRFKKTQRWYLCVGWADSRRRNIYARLERYGFMFMNDLGGKILMKEIT